MAKTVSSASEAVRTRLQEIHAEAIGLALNATTAAEKKAANLAEEAAQHALSSIGNED